MASRHMSKRRKPQDPNYRLARKLAKQLGCEIEIDRIWDLGHTNYYVYGPEEVYDDVPIEEGSIYFDGSLRVDPFDGDHIVHDWSEVVSHLRVYQEDLHFHHLGISTRDAEEIGLAVRGKGDQLHTEWWMTNDDQVGLILADWLLDKERDRLADLIRAAINKKGDK